ncbi:MAG: ABC-F family ATP-binding cassette domain-containing protein [Bacteroidales bacterium]|nr:ABC-F family ATP-binding cassette domain-containing protein [Bacteroidales bacterium]
MVSLDNVTVRFSGVSLFENISVMFSQKEKAGLVGKNGAGKSTLLKLLAGIAQPSEGVVAKPSGFQIGYLPQEMNYADTTTVFKEAEKAFEQLMYLEKQMDSLTRELEERTDYESDGYMGIIDKLNQATEQFQLHDGSKKEAEIEKTLLGLGFLSNQFSRATNTFSGGWRMRIELAKVLLQKPNMLLLDEPTNHLDIESIQWLEQFLQQYEGIVILISHDRAFLDNITTRTVEIELGKLYDYKAPYSKYLGLRKERREQQLAAYRNQQKQITETEDFIERFRYKATKAVQVQSRIKQLDKIDRIQIEEEDNTTVNIRFPEAPRSGTIVVEAKELSKHYGDLTVLDKVDLIIERGEKIAFVGKNGEGKSTLAKIIVAETDCNGLCKIGHNVNIGYYSQNQDELLRGEKTVLQTLDDIAVGDVRKRVRDILGAFLFSGEDVDKKVRVLSGGEKSRLAMARLMLQPYNLLVLDEPTNHLDIRSKDVLKQAIKDYNGTVIIISHDRQFLDGLADRIIEVRNKSLREHTGGIHHFIQKLQKEQNSLLKKENLKNVVQKPAAPKQCAARRKKRN